MAMALWRKSLSSSCSNCERQTKYSCITCGKSVCVLSECSIPEVNISWQPNKRVGYCLKCAPCTEKLVKDCHSKVDDKDHGQRDLTTCIREEEEDESDSWKTNTFPDEAILCIYDDHQFYLIKVLKVMILFIGFQTARRALDGDVAPIYSTPTAGELPKRCHIHHFLHNILFGDWKMRLHRRFPQVSYDRFIWFCALGLYAEPRSLELALNLKGSHNKISLTDMISFCSVHSIYELNIQYIWKITRRIQALYY